MKDQRRYAWYVLGLLTTINLLNYIDRQVLYAVFPLLKPDLALSDTELGALASAFMVVYMCAAPVAGWLGDRWPRNRWIGSGVGLWSIATVASGVSSTYTRLLGARSLVGIGEACYGSLSPSFIAERFEPELRGRVLAVFSMALPVGSALGYVLGGLLGKAYGWRAAFMMVGAPGLVVAVLALMLRDPRGETGAAEGGPSLRDYLSMLENKVWLMDTLAGAAMSFALGGLAAWMPSYFVRHWGMDVGQAGLMFGGVTVAGGFVGSLAGGWLGDWLLKRTDRAYFLLSAVGLFLSVPFGAGMLLAGNMKVALFCLFMAETLIFLNTGPLNALLVDCTPVSVRSMAFAANLFFIHALGDAFSPVLIGKVSDLTDLQTALFMTLVALALSGALCLWGARYIPKRKPA